MGVSGLEFLELLEVAVGKVEDEDSDDNTAEGTPKVAWIAPKVHIKPVEDVPYAPPDEYESDDYGEVVSEIADKVLARRRMVVTIVVFVHVKSISLQVSITRVRVIVSLHRRCSSVGRARPW